MPKSKQQTQSKAVKPSTSAKAAMKTERLQRRYPKKGITESEQYVAEFCTLNNLRN